MNTCGLSLVVGLGLAVLELLHLGLVCFDHLVVLEASLDSWVLVFLLSLSDDTLCFFNVIVDIALDSLAHALDLLVDVLLYFGLYTLPGSLLLSLLVSVIFIDTVTLNLCGLKLGELLGLLLWPDV